MKLLEIEQDQIDTLEPKDKAYIKGFGKGFQVRVYPDRRMVARYRYSIGGRTRIFMLGDLSQIPLDQVLAAHYVAGNAVERGDDPAGERDTTKAKVKQEQAQERVKRGAVTIADVCDRFQSEFKGMRGNPPKPASARTMKEYDNHIKGFIRPKFGGYHADDLLENVIVNALKRKAQDAPVQANRIQASISVIFNWSVKNKLMTENPIRDTDKQNAEESRERALDYDIENDEIIDIGEIRTFWNGLDTINPLHRIALQMSLITGQRIGECLNAKWSNFVNGKWIIPAANTKNKKGAHKLPVVPKLKALLDELKPLSGESEYLFPSQNGKPIKNAAISTRLRKLHQQKDSPFMDMKQFTAHDLRRTCATNLKKLGYLDAEIGVLLNHTGQSITQIYAKGIAEKRIKAMLSAWHRRLDRILAGKTASDKSNNVMDFG